MKTPSIVQHELTKEQMKKWEKEYGSRFRRVDNTLVSFVMSENPRDLIVQIMVA